MAIETVKPKPQAIERYSKNSSGALKHLGILLTKLSYARQAPLDPNMLAYYSQELAQLNQIDAHQAIDHLCKTRRSEGETAFPDLPTILECVRTFRARREQEEARAKITAEDQHRKDHPEEYVWIGDIPEFQNFLKSKNMPKVP